MNFRPTKDDQNYARKVLLPWMIVIIVALVTLIGLYFIPLITLSVIGFGIAGLFTLILWKAFATTEER